MGEILSVKDYFHYYFSGLIWLFDLWLLMGNKISPSETIGWVSQAPASLAAVCIIVAPFVVGFVFNPLGNCVTLLIRRITGGDPANWMLVLRGQTYKDGRRKRLAEPWRSSLLSKITSLSGGNEIKHSPFFWVRAFVDLNAPSHVRRQIQRVLSLANFTESLLLPVPLLTFLLLRQTHCAAGIILSIGLFCVLSWRYRRLRIYWVQHVYRNFYFLSFFTRVKTG